MSSPLETQRNDFLTRARLRLLALTDDLSRNGVGDGRVLDLSDLLCDSIDVFAHPIIGLPANRQLRLIERLRTLLALDMVAPDELGEGEGPLPFEDAEPYADPTAAFKMPGAIYGGKANPALFQPGYRF